MSDTPPPAATPDPNASDRPPEPPQATPLPPYAQAAASPASPAPYPPQPPTAPAPPAAAPSPYPAAAPYAAGPTAGPYAAPVAPGSYAAGPVPPQTWSGASVPPPGYAHAPAPGYGYPAVRPAYAYPAQAKTNALAVVSLIASLAAFVLWWTYVLALAGIVGVVTGHIALGQIRRTNERGRGMALAGVIIGWCFIALGIGVGLLIWGLFSSGVSDGDNI